MFLACQWHVIASMAGACRIGIAAQEVDAACRLMHVPRKEWPVVFMGVRVMASAAAAVLNEKKD